MRWGVLKVNRRPLCHHGSMVRLQFHVRIRNAPTIDFSDSDYSQSHLHRNDHRPSLLTFIIYSAHSRPFVPTSCATKTPDTLRLQSRQVSTGSLDHRIVTRRDGR